MLFGTNMAYDPIMGHTEFDLGSVGVMTIEVPVTPRTVGGEGSQQLGNDFS